MARTVDNLLGLAVLATVVERPMHRYEMARVMRERSKDRDMAVSLGSLYTVVRNLEKHGFVEVEGVDRNGARPERTIYRITPAGVTELRDWVRDLLIRPRPEARSFTAALSVMAVLPPAEATELLAARAVALEEELAGRRAELHDYGDRVARLFLIEGEYEIAVLTAEYQWVTSLLDELRHDRFPGRAEWDRNARTLSAPIPREAATNSG